MWCLRNEISQSAPLANIDEKLPKLQLESRSRESHGMDSRLQSNTHVGYFGPAMGVQRNISMIHVAGTSPQNVC